MRRRRAAAPGSRGGRPAGHALAGARLADADLPLALQLLGLLGELVERVGERGRPGRGAGDGPEHMIPAHVHDDFHDVPVLLNRQDHLTRNDAAVQQPVELVEPELGRSMQRRA